MSEARAELIIIGRIATLAGESGWGWESGVAIADGRVIGVGAESELESLANGATKWRRLDESHVVLPGITDAHLHLMMLIQAETADRSYRAGPCAARWPQSPRSTSGASLPATATAGCSVTAGRCTISADGRTRQMLEAVAPGRPRGAVRA